MPNAPARIFCRRCDFQIAPGTAYRLLDGKAYHRTCMIETRLEEVEASVFLTGAPDSSIEYAPATPRPMGRPDTRGEPDR